MNKVIAVNDKGEQLLTTEQTAEKNNWWVTYCVTVVPGDQTATADNKKVPVTGGLMKSLGGKIYRLSEVKPAHICYLCHQKGANRIKHLFYCNQHFNQLVVTQPILRTGKKPHRNEPCHCKSGKKYKKCCGMETHTPRHYFNSKYKNHKTA